MNAYTVSRLAQDAGVSVHVVRDYLLRGLLRPAARTAGGYGVFDADALQRLCFVRAAFEAGVGLDVLARLCGRWTRRMPVKRRRGSPNCADSSNSGAGHWRAWRCS